MGTTPTRPRPDSFSAHAAMTAAPATVAPPIARKRRRPSCAAGALGWTSWEAAIAGQPLAGASAVGVGGQQRFEVSGPGEVGEHDRVPRLGGDDRRDERRTVGADQLADQALVGGDGRVLERTCRLDDLGRGAAERRRHLVDCRSERLARCGLADLRSDRLAVGEVGLAERDEQRAGVLDRAGRQGGVVELDGSELEGLRELQQLLVLGCRAQRGGGCTRTGDARGRAALRLGRCDDGAVRGRVAARRVGRGRLWVVDGGTRCLVLAGVAVVGVVGNGTCSTGELWQQRPGEPEHPCADQATPRPAFVVGCGRCRPGVLHIVVHGDVCPFQSLRSALLAGGQRSNSRSQSADRSGIHRCARADRVRPAPSVERFRLARRSRPGRHAAAMSSKRRSTRRSPGRRGTRRRGWWRRRSATTSTGRWPSRRPAPARTSGCRLIPPSTRSLGDASARSRPRPPRRGRRLDGRCPRAPHARRAHARCRG